mgnify:FL=1
MREPLKKCCSNNRIFRMIRYEKSFGQAACLQRTTRSKRFRSKTNDQRSEFARTVMPRNERSLTGKEAPNNFALIDRKISKAGGLKILLQLFGEIV